jgi:hypothetical protein
MAATQIACIPISVPWTPGDRPRLGGPRLLVAPGTDLHPVSIGGTHQMLLASLGKGHGLTADRQQDSREVIVMTAIQDSRPSTGPAATPATSALSAAIHALRNVQDEQIRRQAQERESDHVWGPEDHRGGERQLA